MAYRPEPGGVVIRTSQDANQPAGTITFSPHLQRALGYDLRRQCKAVDGNIAIVKPLRQLKKRRPE